MRTAGRWSRPSSASPGSQVSKSSRFPGGCFRSLPPCVPLSRELTEMRYLWQMPVRMTNEHLDATLGQEPRTPLEVALRATITNLRCL